MTEQGALAATPQGATLKVRVGPGARKAGLRVQDNRIVVRVQAPAVDGKANKAVLALFARPLGFSRAQVTILRGEKSREKTLLFASVDAEVLRAQLLKVYALELAEPVD